MKKIGSFLTVVLIGAAVIAAFYSILGNMNKDVTKETKVNGLTVKGFYNINPYTANTYVVSSDKGVLVVDIGDYGKDVKEYINKLGGADYLLITHGHWDQVYGLDEFKKDYPNATIYMPESEIEFLGDPYLNQSDKMTNKVILKTVPSKITEGIIEAGKYKINMYLVPGHTIGSSMYYIDDSLLFIGDTIKDESVMPTNFPTGSDTMMKQSLQRIIDLDLDKDLIVFPSHGNKTTYKDLTKIAKEYINK